VSVDGFNDYKFKSNYIQCLKINNDCETCKRLESRVGDVIFIEQARKMMCKKKDLDYELITCIKSRGCDDCKPLLKYFIDKKNGDKIFKVFCDKIKEVVSDKTKETFTNQSNSSDIVSQEEFEKRYNDYLKKKLKRQEESINVTDYEYCLKNVGCHINCKKYRYMIPKSVYYKIKHKYCRPKSKQDTADIDKILEIISPKYYQTPNIGKYKSFTK
jgi:hypothetical protein